MSCTAGQPEWHQPLPANPASRLCVYNTLTRTKVPFVPSSGNRIRWYSCGPTVYDAAHIGHARNYMTFDILRRLFTDYFGYECLYVMNVTDIDDKIILRARQDHLVEQFKKENATISNELVEKVEGIWKEYVQGKLGVVADQPSSHVLDNVKGPASTDDEAKYGMYLETARKSLLAILAARSAVGESSSAMIDDCHDILAPELDRNFGATVTDHKIFRDLAAFWEADFLEDMAALNVRPADVLVRVSQVIPEIVGFCQKVMDNGYAYSAEGSVYFDVAAFHNHTGHNYAKLCPWSAGNSKFFEEGEGALGVRLSGKKDPRDFALWKASKSGEPSWPSPWGPGRPGWHIECSVMASSVVPGCLDIHSGGIDLAFPHHDNEMAQSEAYYECDQWVNYFLHAGHVHIEGHKMSKSLKNFVTIKEALGRYSARQLRIMFLQHLWSATITFKDSAIETAVAAEATIANFFQNAQALIRESEKPENSADAHASPKTGQEERELLDILAETQDIVHRALCDSFDTPTAMLALLELINKTNVYISVVPSPSPYVLRLVAGYETKILSVFGVVENPDSIGFKRPASNAQETLEDVEQRLRPILETVSSYRDQVRAAALSDATDRTLFLKLSDQLRADLVVRGIVFEDRTNKPSLVKFADPAELNAAAEARDAEKLEKKLRLVKLQEQRGREKAERARILPSELFKSDPLAYSRFDENGVPTHDSKGEELSKNARKKLMKEYQAHVELHEKVSQASRQ